MCGAGCLGGGRSGARVKWESVLGLGIPRPWTCTALMPLLCWRRKLKMAEKSQSFHFGDRSEVRWPTGSKQSWLLDYTWLG